MLPLGKKWNDVFTRLSSKFEVKQETCLKTRYNKCTFNKSTMQACAQFSEKRRGAHSNLAPPNQIGTLSHFVLYFCAHKYQKKENTAYYVLHANTIIFI